MSDWSVMDPEYWTRGDPGAPPHVKEFWVTPDYANLPEDRPPYRWDVETGVWVSLHDEIPDLPPQPEDYETTPYHYNPEINEWVEVNER